MHYLRRTCDPHEAQWTFKDKSNNPKIRSFGCLEIWRVAMRLNCRKCLFGIIDLFLMWLIFRVKIDFLFSRVFTKTPNCLANSRIGFSNSKVYNSMVLLSYGLNRFRKNENTILINAKNLWKVSSSDLQFHFFSGINITCFYEICYVVCFT